MSRNNYGYVGRRSGGAAWQWIIIGAVLGFGCSVALVLVGLAGGIISLDPNSVAQLPTSTPFIITATPAPVTPTTAPTDAPATEAPTQGIVIEAPTATPTIDATFLTLQAPTATQGQALQTGDNTAEVNSFSGNNSGDLFAQLSSSASELVPVEGGTFTMGTNPSEVAAAVQECVNGYGGDPGTCQVSDGDDSYPEHTVTVSSFSMERTEVSYRQFIAFMNAMGPGSHRNGCGGQPCMQTRNESETSNIQFDSNAYSVLLAINEFPMANVTWYGARAYCEAIGRRLPTEAEWEYAAHGGESLIYPWGNTWVAENASTRRPADGSAPATYPVTSFLTGATVGVSAGILNMAGNVQEWVSDWYDPRFYGRPEATITDPTGPVTGTEKVLRGGSWDTVPFYARTIHRRSADPNLPNASIGFRCVEDANSAANQTGPLNTTGQNTGTDLAAPTIAPLTNDTNTNSQPTMAPPATTAPTATTSGPVPTLVPGG